MYRADWSEKWLNGIINAVKDLEDLQYSASKNSKLIEFSPCNSTLKITKLTKMFEQKHWLEKFINSSSEKVNCFNNSIDIIIQFSRNLSEIRKGENATTSFSSSAIDILSTADSVSDYNVIK